MKKHIILLIGVILLGGVTIFLPKTFLAQNEVNKLKTKNLQQEEYLKQLEEISSSIDTIEEELNHGEREPEIYNEQQIYFKNGEILYSYLTIGQADIVKSKINSYINQSESSIVECEILNNSFRQNDHGLSFKVKFGEDNRLLIEINKDLDSGNIDITLVHEL